MTRVDPPQFKQDWKLIPVNMVFQRSKSLISIDQQAVNPIGNNTVGNSSEYYIALKKTWSMKHASSGNLNNMEFEQYVFAIGFDELEKRVGSLMNSGLNSDLTFGQLMETMKIRIANGVLHLFPCTTSVPPTTVVVYHVREKTSHVRDRLPPS